MSKEGTFPIKPKMDAVQPPVWKRFTKDEFLKMVYDNYGVVTAIASVADCTLKQFYSAIDHWKLRDDLSKSRENLISLAERTIVDCMKSEDEHVKLQAATAALRLGGQKYGWTSSPQIQVANQVNVVDSEAAIKQIFGVE